MKLTQWLARVFWFTVGAGVAFASVPVAAQIMRFTDGTIGTKVAIFGTNGVEVTSFGGGTQYAEDAASADGNIGTVALCQQQSSPANTAGTNGDWTFLQCSAGYLWTRAPAIETLLAGGLPAALAGNGGLKVGPSYAEDVAHVSADQLVPAGFIRSDTTPASTCGTAGDYCLGNLDANGRLYVNATFYNSAGAEISASTQGTQDGALGTITNVTGGLPMWRASAAAPTDVSADGDAVLGWALRNGSPVFNLAFGGTLVTAAGLGIYVEDAAETAGGNLMMAGSVRRDAPVTSAGTTGDNATINTNASGAVWTSDIDPCASEVKTTDPFSLTARAVIVAAAASKKNYICAITVVAGAAEIINIDEGTGTTCQTGTAAIAGSTTAANGLSFAANGGFVGVGGNATVLAGKTSNVDTCLVPSGSNRVSGFVTWVQR